jgi:hypothetical protein
MTTKQTSPKVTVEDTPEGRLIVYAGQELYDLFGIAFWAAALVATFLLLRRYSYDPFVWFWTLCAWGWIYFAFAETINKTFVLINETVTIKNGPVPWRRQFRVISSEVDRADYSQVKRRGTRYGYGVRLFTKTGRSYRIATVRREVDAVQLVKHLLDGVRRLKV